MKRAFEFAKVRAEGSSTAGRFLVLSSVENSSTEGTHSPAFSRFGIITTRRLGHAVTRNLLRRRIRELLRAHGEPLSQGRYVVVIPRKPAATASYEELQRDFQKVLKRHLRATQAPC